MCQEHQKDQHKLLSLLKKYCPPSGFSMKNLIFFKSRSFSISPDIIEINVQAGNLNIVIIQNLGKLCVFFTSETVSITPNSKRLKK